MNEWELRLINPSTGLADVVLGDVATWQISPVISDAGTVQFTYPRNGANWSQLALDKDLAIYYRGAELGRLRSTIEQCSWDDANTNEEGDIATYTCRLSIARLERAVVYPSGWPTSSNPPNYTFTGATAGYVMKTLLTLAQARGTVTEIDFSSFDETYDSNGVAWSETISIEWNAQTTYLQIINDLQSYGLADAEMEVYALHLYDFQTMGSDLTTTNPPVVVHKGRDLTQSNFQGSTRALRTVALMSGSNNLYVESEDSGAVSEFGRREIGSSASGVTDPTQLTNLGVQFIDSVDAQVNARTNQFTLGDPMTPVPGDTFDLGDWLWTDIDGSLHRQRVIQWSLQCANDGTVSGTTAMDTIFGEFLTRLQARVDAIESGAVIVGASQPDPVVANTVPPMIPGGLTAGTNAYLDNQGHTLAYIIASWDAVTEDQSGAAISDLQAYIVQFKIHADTDWTTYTTDSSTLSQYVGALPPDVEYDVQVGAVDSQANFSGWSSVFSLTTATDTTPPNEPSTPAVASQLGQIAITWDGKDSGGLNMPGDFDHTAVYLSSSSPTFTPSLSNMVGSFKSAGTLTVPGAVLTYGTTYYARLVSFDQSGNASATSTAGSATLVQVVNTDIATGQVGLNNLSFSDVGNLIDDGSFEDPNWRSVRNTAFGGTHFAFTNSTASNGLWSVVHTGTAGQITEDVNLTQIPANVGQTFMAAVDWNSSSLVTGTMFVQLQVDWLDATQTYISSSTLSTNWTSPATNDGVWHQRVSGSGGVAPTGTAYALFVLKAINHTAGTINLDAVEIRLQVDNLLVADAAITDAKIGTVSANKIIAGTLSAGVIISGSIGTAASGQRCVMDGTGFHGYDSSGNLVFDVNNYNDVITLSQGTTGPKVTIDTIGIYPTIRLYDVAGSNNAFFNASNLDGNTAALGINSGNYTVSTSTYRNRLFMQGSGFGIRLQVIDDTNQANNGGLVQLTYNEAIFGLFVEGATHGGQALFSYDSTNSDATFELDGYMTGSIFAQSCLATGYYTGLTSGSGGASLGYGPTMYSLTHPICQYSCGTIGTVGGNVNALTSTGFAFTLAGTSPASWSALFLAGRTR